MTTETPVRNASAAGSSDLVNGPIGRTLVLFALPTLLSSALQSASGSINTLWVGRFLGDDAIAATANGNIVMFLMLAFVFGFGMAATILIGQRFGRGDQKGARLIAGVTLGTFVPATVVISILTWIFSPTLLDLLNTPSAAYQLSLSYLRVIVIGIPFMLTFSMATMALRGAGDSTTPLIFIALSVVLDSGMNPLLIAGIGPFPELGIAGAALATLIANAIALPLMIVYLYIRRSPLALPTSELGALKPDLAILKTVLTKGLPIGLQMVIISTAALTMLRLVNAEGVETTAGYAVIQQIWTYLQMPAMAVGAAVSAMAAQNIGAGRWDRVEVMTRDGLILSVGLTVLIGQAIWIFDDALLGLFMDETSLSLPIAKHIFVLASWGFIAFAASLVLFGTIRANGVVMPPLIILFIAMYPVRLSFAYGAYGWLGADALWWSFPIGMISILMMAAAYYRFGPWRNKTLEAVPHHHECEMHARCAREPGGAVAPA